MARFVFFGLSITSAWGNGHATTYRALIKALAARGHDVTFLERDVPWYRSHRDFARLPYCRVLLYREFPDLEQFKVLVRDADAVIVGSYVPDGIAVGSWAIRCATGLTAFYDIDTPVTLAALSRGDCAYVAPGMLRAYDVYLSFTGGPALERLTEMGALRAEALYCSVDPALHSPVKTPRRWDLGYLGTYSPDRQPALERLLFGAAAIRSEAAFAVAGPQYPHDTNWPSNVTYIPHLAPDAHPEFYCAQNFTLNLTRADMRALGYSPSVRLFEAAACGVPIISDRWQGLETIFSPGREILTAEDTDELVAHLRNTSELKRREIAAAARKHVLQHHTAAHRARELEAIFRVAAHKSKPRTGAALLAGSGA
jgi:spore maturation protein CgeB